MEWTNTIKALEAVGSFTIQRFRDKLNKPDPFSSNATWNLYNGISTRIEVSDTKLRLLFHTPEDETDPVTNVTYLEQGRKPGKWVPVKVLEKWVLQRNIQFTNVNQKRMIYLINRSIYSGGIKPKPYLNEIREEIKFGIHQQNIKNALKQDIQAQLKNSFSK